MSDTLAVRRRRVFYIPGYDPFHPRRYRELYRKEGAAQAALSGYRIEQGRGVGTNAWTVRSIQGAHRVHVDMEVLVWSDIVQRSMARSIPATYAHLARTAWTYVASGALFRLMRLRAGPVIAALYPIAMLLAQAAVALGLGIATALGSAWLLEAGGASVWRAGPAALAGAAAAWAVLRAFRSADGKLFAYYLMHDYAFTARWRGAYPKELEDRLASFAERIRAAMRDDYDEVLVVGHSSGAHLGVSVLADLLRGGLEPRGRLSFLSLGQVVPMVSFLPEAHRLRADLHAMGAQEAVPWVDVTAPGDGCAFALCDPVAVSGVAPSSQRAPLVLSAAFSRTLSPARMRALGRRWFRLHFQYLCAFDALAGEVGEYDYFRVTAGPMRLAERFAARAPSPSRLTRPVNRFTTLAPSLATA